MARPIRMAQPKATTARTAPAIRPHRPDLLDARHMMYDAANAPAAATATTLSAKSTAINSFSPRLEAAATMSASHVWTILEIGKGVGT
jgi:hypothetical protein